DLTGMTAWKVITNADFRELLGRHLARVEAEITPVEPYSDADPFADYMAIYDRRAERLAAAGYIDFLDETRDTWRYNTWGALACVGRQYKESFGQILRNYGRQQTVKRPGDPGYVPSDRRRSRAWLRY